MLCSIADCAEVSKKHKEVSCPYPPVFIEVEGACIIRVCNIENAASIVLECLCIVIGGHGIRATRQFLIITDAVGIVI